VHPSPFCPSPLPLPPWELVSPAVFKSSIYQVTAQKEWIFFLFFFFFPFGGSVGPQIMDYLKTIQADLKIFENNLFGYPENQDWPFGQSNIPFSANTTINGPHHPLL
jgi:hypothetical protein